MMPQAEGEYLVLGLGSLLVMLAECQLLVQLHVAYWNGKKLHVELTNPLMGVFVGTHAAFSFLSR